MYDATVRGREAGYGKMGRRIDPTPRSVRPGGVVRLHQGGAGWSAAPPHSAARRGVGDPLAPLRAMRAGAAELRSLATVLGAALAVLCLLAATPSAAAPRHVYLTWQGDPATRITVNYHTLEPASAGISQVFYDTEPRQGELAAYRFRAYGAGHTIPGLADGRTVHWVELTDLQPDTDYYFAAGDAAGGFSDERLVRTLSDDERPLRFVAGGDLSLSEIMRQLLVQAAAQSPRFALVGGDLAYANGEVTGYAIWDEWLDRWEEVMVTPEGQTIPMVCAIGNHEVSGGYDGGPEDAPFYLGYLAQNGDQTYYARRLGANAALLVLDSSHIAHPGGKQAAWLEEQLEQLTGVPYTIACYHVPLFPGFRLPTGSYVKRGREHWLPLFDRYELTAAFENHDHMFKRAKRIRHMKPDSAGTLYLGDGSWGKGPRWVRGPRRTELVRRWYVERLESKGHVWVVDVTADGVTYSAVDPSGEVFDWVETLRVKRQAATSVP